MTDKVAAIAIGRNEGDRFKRCLTSLTGKVDPIIYVDSGSTDGSVAAARAAGAHVVDLKIGADESFTAARARNAGLLALKEISPDGRFVQFLDGDCELQDGWIDTALSALCADPGLAAVCGRRREKFPEASVWNRMIDEEWATPIGTAIACGGDAMMRREALDDVDGYDASLIAGEEPEMCYRMRHHAKAWRIERLDAEMTLHDADLHSIAKVWKRAERAGHAYAESAALHGHEPEGFRVAETRRAMLWGGVFLALLAAILVFWPWGLLGLGLLPLQVLRLTLSKGMPLDRAAYLTFGKLPEAIGVFSFWWGRLRGRRRGNIFYK